MSRFVWVILFFVSACSGQKDFEGLIVSKISSEDPVAEYNFKCEIEDKVKDISDNENTMELKNGASVFEDCESKVMLICDGENDYGLIDEHQDLNIQDAITISVKMRTEDTLSTSDRRKEILTRNGSNLFLGWEKDVVDDIDWLRFSIKYTDGHIQDAELRDDYIGTDLRDGEWHTITGVFQKTVGSEKGMLYLYVDGVLKDSEEARRDLGIKLSSNSNDYIVCAKKVSSGIERNLEVDIDYLKIYDYKLLP